MKINNSQNLINEFGKILTKALEKNFFLKESLLPKAKSELKEAFLLYLFIVSDSKDTTKEKIFTLMHGYSLLSHFISDSTADKLEQILSDYEKNKTISEENDLFLRTMTKSVCDESDKLLSEIIDKALKIKPIKHHVRDIRKNFENIKNEYRNNKNHITT